MKLKAVFALPVIAVLALPGQASQPTSPADRLVAMQKQLGVTVDPYAAVDFSLKLPTGYTTLDVSADPFATGA